MIFVLFEVLWTLVAEGICSALPKRKNSLLAAMGRWNRAQAKKAGL